MIYLPLILIPAIFVLFIFLKPKIKGIELCGVCAAVSITWLILLFGIFLLIIPVSPLLVGILMGMSVVGGLSKAEPWLKKQNVQRIRLIKIIVILGGLYTIFFLLEQEWQSLIVTVIVSLLILVIVGFLLQGRHKDKHEMKEHLKDCC
ncbi:hypothetical protein HY771_03985 [Candidatus Uhrbacteria bacterium]|nr:hypothetical protein [Candidatus Uhrbacteria bacterium]